jgi:uncharacterized protein (DUF169 family)
LNYEGKSEKLKRVLKLRNEPVGVKYTDKPPEEREEGCYPVCGAIPAAAGGKTIVLSKETCACPGGIVHIGLSAEVRVPGEMLVEGEKLWADMTAFHRSAEATKKIAEPPFGLGNNIVFYPLGEGTYEPDLVILLVNAEQACRLVTLSQFWDGKQTSMEMRGSLCWGAVTYPLVSGNLDVSLGDTSARRMENWDPTLLIVSIPWRKLDDILEAMDFSTAGTAESAEFFQKMTEKMASRKYKASDLREELKAQDKKS